MNAQNCEERGIKILKEMNGCVLCVWERGSKEIIGRTFVTWRVGLDGEFDLGHYTPDIEEAVADFQRRVKV